MSVILMPDEGQEIELSSTGRLTIPWMATGSSLREDVVVAVQDTSIILPQIDGRILDRIRIGEEGPGTWRVTVEYALPGEADGLTSDDPQSAEVLPRDISTDFSIQSESVHITHSLQTVSSKWVSGFTAKDFKKAINVDPNGVAQGVEIGTGNTAATTFSIRRRFSTAFLLLAEPMFLAIEAKAGTVCDHEFRGRAVGEVLFLGVSGSIDNANPTSELSYEFAVSPNKTGITIGPFENVDKKGWEYGWTYQAKRSTKGKVETVGLLIERVFEYAAFDDIGL